MKVLSVQQPWATLICAGIKDVENRTWKAAKVPGRILIHASSKKVTRNFFENVPYEIEATISNHIFLGNIAPVRSLPTSAIIGYVTVTGFDDGEMDTIWADGPGIYKWKLEEAYMFKEPILDVKGKLNLFDYDLDENNLPPAYKVNLLDIRMEGKNLIVPVMDGTIDDIDNKVIDSISYYDVPGMTDILYQNEETEDLKPFKKVILEENNRRAEYELNGDLQVLYDVVSEEDNSIKMVRLLDGSETPIVTINFKFGKKIREISK